MKTLSLTALLMTLMVGLVSHAGPAYGSKCGLIDEADLFNMKNIDSMQLTWRSKFTDLEKAQIMQAAKQYGPKDIRHALADLIENSEAGEVYYETGFFKGAEYQVVLYYPGGNPGGTIFRKGSSVPLAEIQDSDIVCK